MQKLITPSTHPSETFHKVPFIIFCVYSCLWYQSKFLSLNSSDLESTHEEEGDNGSQPINSSSTELNLYAENISSVSF